MFDYTQTAIKKIFDDFKKFCHVCSIVTQSIYIGYLLYSICAQTGRWWIKTIFLTVSVAYFIFYLVVHHSKKYKLEKTGKKFFKRSKLALKLFELIVAFYSIAVTINDATTPSVILLSLMLVGWLLQVVFDVIISILENRAGLFMEALKADIEEAKRPMDTVSNLFKKLSGQPIEPAPQKSKHRIWLDEHVVITRQTKKEKKQAEKQAKKQRLAEYKAQKKAQRSAKKHPQETLPPPEEHKKKGGKK